MGETSFEREVLDRLTKIEVGLNSYEKIKDQTYDNQRNIIRLNERDDQHEEKIAKLEDHNKWLARALGAAIISAFIGIVTLFIKIGMGI